MSSLKSRLVIFAVQHSHLLKGKLKREVVDEHTSIPNLRAQFEAGAQKFGGIPAGVTVSPVTIPELPKGLSAEWIHPAGSANSPCAADRAIFYTHGGGYISGNCIDHRNHVAKFVKSSGIGALLYDYRLAPEHPFPAAMDDTLAAYRWLTAQGVEPQKTIIVGESAGGGLCLASLLAIRDTGLPLPAAGVALSPWVDLTCTSGSYRTNAYRDISTLGSWQIWNRYYYGANDPKTPWISPLYGDLHGLPPMMIVVGDHEIMLDDACKFAAKAKEAGVEMTLRVWEGMVHCFPMFAPAFKEATEAWDETIAYIRSKV